MDGLSLDPFRQKLTNIPLSFNPAFQKGLFLVALQQVIEVNSLLNMAFHMLQTIYSIYQQLIVWCKYILEWKKIKMSKVLDNFKSAHILNAVVLEEAECLVVDHFLSKQQ